MHDLLTLIEEQHSARVPFDPGRPVARGDVRRILEAARWSPTAHNMQNFDIVVVDDRKLLDEIGAIRVRLSEEFMREHLQLLSSSEEELRRRKIGLLGSMLPEWMGEPATAEAAIPLGLLLAGCPVLLVVLHDATRRAPVKNLITAPDRMKIAFAARLGHPVTSAPYVRVRREVAEFAHWNHFGETTRPAMF